MHYKHKELTFSTSNGLAKWSKALEGGSVKVGAQRSIRSNFLGTYILYNF